MQRWMLETAQFVILAGLAFGLHGVIRRSGERYASDVFEGSPGTGRTFLVLADIGYYLIFAAYALFNLQFETGLVSAKDAEEVVYSVGGVALIIGILHVVNIVALPFMARMLAGRDRAPEGGGSALRGKLGDLQVIVTLNGPGAARI